LSRKEKEMALNEVRILASIKSPYIIRYKESFTDSDYQHLYIVMEFAENGDILGLIEKQKKEKKRMEE
jgi:NIMA (never in mitosis gene a)-related kinase